MTAKPPSPFDHLNPHDYRTDKFDHGYLVNYSRLIGHRRGEQLKILELGVHEGGSLELFHDAFPNATIVGLDIGMVELRKQSRRIHVYRGSQDDGPLLQEIAARHAPDGFDLIIDDAAHIGAISRRSFWTLFPMHLKSLGVYSIEDWGTAFWPDWPDGEMPDRIGQPARNELERERTVFPSHQRGMAGFIKELMDELALPDITHKCHGLPPQQRSLIHRMELSLGQAIVIRSTARARN